MDLDQWIKLTRRNLSTQKAAISERPLDLRFMIIQSLISCWNTVVSTYLLFLLVFRGFILYHPSLSLEETLLLSSGEVKKEELGIPYSAF